LHTDLTDEYATDEKLKSLNRATRFRETKTKWVCLLKLKTTCGIEADDADQSILRGELRDCFDKCASLTNHRAQ
jgi:hypothetical protein